MFSVEIITSLSSFLLENFAAFLLLFRVEKIYANIENSIKEDRLQSDFRLSNLQFVMSRISALTGILVCAPPLFINVGLVQKLS